MFQHLIIAISKIESKKIAEIVVRPNFNDSDDFSLLIKNPNIQITPTFTYQTGITADDLADALDPTEAFSILRDTFEAHKAPWFAWSEFDAALIRRDMPGISKSVTFLEELVQKKTRQNIQDIDHAIQSLRIPQMGDETDTEKMQKILQKINSKKNIFCEEKKTKKYIIEIGG